MNATPYAARQAWLSNLKAGDAFALPRTTTGHGASREHDLVTIQRTTAAQFIAEAAGRELRIRRKDGAVIGDRLKFIRQPGTVRMVQA